MAKYTITEIARLCETSPATVSRVFNNPGLVAQPLRERIQRIVSEVGYKPNPFASRLGSDARWGLALFVFDILNPFFALIVRRIGHLAMEQGIPLTVCDTENNAEKEKIYLDYLLDNKIGGIIFAEGVSAETIERAQSATEIVLIDRRHTSGSAAEVSSDNYLGGRQAVEYLVHLNHRRIGFIGGPEGWTSAEDRHRGYRDTLEQFDIPYREEFVYRGDLRFESGINALDYFLTLSPWPTAIFSANDQMAFGVLTRAHNLKISIPDDISLVGFDDIPLSSLHTTQLTAVQQDIDALCTHAFKIMLGKIGERAGPTLKSRVVVPTRLKIGETCAMCPPKKRDDDGDRI